MADTSRRYFWALISPSPQRSVSYLKSDLASAAARQLECGQYLAIVLEPSTVHNPLLGPQRPTAMAHLVQRADDVLPDTYLPIAPCQVQSPHAPLAPGFAWPFVDCVIYTGKRFVFKTVNFDRNMVDPRHVLPPDAALSFTAICDDDDYAQRRMDAARTKAEKAEVGVLGDEDGDWSAFSGDSAKAGIVPGPGQLFSPSEINADISFDIETLSQVLPANRCFEDVRNVERLRARFSRPSTERTIIWTLNQPPFELGEAPPNVDAPELENDHLLRLSSTLERPPSPYISSTEQDDKEEEEDDDPEAGWGGDDWLDGISVFRFPLRPKIEPRALVVMYFDLYGTLIDHETGIFNGLSSLLARSTSRFSRYEALSFYFETESEVKKAQPHLPYPRILAEAYTDMALRLGLTSTEKECSTFAASLINWPLFADAIPCLQTLRPYIPVLIGVADIEYTTLLKTDAFPLLQPYLAETFAWEPSNGYRPEAGVYPPISYHDGMGVPREHRVHISSALYPDIEYVSEDNIAAVWMRRLDSLAANVPAPSENDSFHWKVCETLPQLVSEILAAKAEQYCPPIN